MVDQSVDGQLVLVGQSAVGQLWLVGRQLSVS